MAISSINIQTAKAHCFSHNDRSDKVTYLVDDSKENEFDRSAEEAKRLLEEYITEAEKNYYERVGRKIKSDTIKAVEAVVNLNAGHTLKDVQILAEEIEKEFGFRSVQIAIHRDEGKSVKDKNYHAHIVMCNLRPDGSTIQRTVGRDGLKKLQDITADSLMMKRGEKGSQAVRLEHRAFKAVEQTKEMLQDKINTLESQRSQLAKQNYRQDIELLEQTKVINRLNSEIEAYKFRDMQQRISGLDATTEDKKELHKLNTQVNKSEDKSELLAKLEEAIKQLEEHKIEDNSPTKEQINTHGDTLRQMRTYTGAKIIESSKIKGIMGEKIDEKTLETNIDKVLEAHNSAHQKSFEIISALFKFKDSIIEGAKFIVKRTELAFKAILTPKEEKRSFERKRGRGMEM